MDEQSKYELRGVSATKDEVHEAIRHLDKGLYPTAFCKILPDITGRSDQHSNIMHADTAGTKTSLAYLYWRETNDLSIWKGISQDAIVMNVDDMACVGCTDQIILSSTIGRNKNLITGAVLSEIIRGTSDFVAQMKDQGIHLYLAGGETADVGDIVRTIDVGFTTFARMRKEDLLINNIQAGDLIVGLSSIGQTSYENEPNSGMGSNGLTAARHDVLSTDHAQRYPESFDPQTDPSVIFTGQYRLTDQVESLRQFDNVGRALLSPTRTYLPVLKAIYENCKSEINGVIHCTGGGQSKVLKFIKDKHVIKDSLFPTPPLFSLIQSSSGTSWKEMYQVFNMGHRMEIYIGESAASQIIDIANSFHLEAKIVGRVEAYRGEQVTIKHDDTLFTYP